MAEYTLSHAATADIAEIFDYSLYQFGIEKATKYYHSLQDTFCRLLTHPYMGQSVAHLHPNLRCHKHQSHMIFYRIENNGIFIVRILHQKRDMEQL